MEGASILSVDAIVVLGCAVRPDGTPSPALERRIRGGVELFRQGRAGVIVMTGGAVANVHVEAHVMADFAHKLGVPRAALIVEDRARTTQENAERTRGLVEGRVTVVSDDWHLPRAARIFREHFDCVEVHAVRGGRRSRAKGFLREALIRIVQ